jgi:hypothetical protein
MGKKEAIDSFKEISRKHNLKVFVLYTYNLTKQAKSKKVRFVYVLKGRGADKGLVVELKGRWLAPGCFMIPISQDEEMQEVFEHWKIPHQRRKILTKGGKC